MTFVHVAIEQTTHTCPADREPHAVDTRRTVLAIVEGGPCRNPITVQSGDTTTIIACGRHEPSDRQCPACRVTVIERAIITHHDSGQRLTTGTAA